MRCPICKGETNVIDEAPKLAVAKERRKCLKCCYAFDVAKIKRLNLWNKKRCK